MRSSRSKFLRDLDWNLLKLFGEVVRSGGVSRAARLLSRQQPAVSSALRRLEDHLGVVVCRRGPSGFELTDQGAALFAICEKLEALVEQIPGAMNVSSGEIAFQMRLLIMGDTVSRVFDDTIAAFSRRYPRAELLINVALVTNIEEAILHLEADIGVAAVTVKKEKLRYDWLYREQYRPFCGRDHPLFGRTFADPHDLSDQPFILPGFEETEVFRQYRARFGWGKKAVGQSEDLAEVKRLVLAGLGIAFLPEEMLESDVRAGRLWPLMPPSPEAQANIYVITNPAAPRAQVTSLFLDLLAAHQRARTHELAANTLPGH